MITDLELGDSCANGFNFSSQFNAKDLSLWSEDAGKVPPHERLGLANGAVRAVDCSRVDLDEYLVCCWHRTLDFFESQNVWTSVFIVDNCSHWFTSIPGFIADAELGRGVSTFALLETIQQAFLRQSRAELGARSELPNHLPR